MQKANEKKKILWQLIGLFAFLLILVLVATRLGVFSTPNNQHRIRVRLEASGGYAIISYAFPADQMDDSQTVSTPWRKSFTAIGGDEVYVTAGNPAQSGQIHCEIELDGKTWKEETAVYPDQTVACAGIIPRQ